MRGMIFDIDGTLIDSCAADGDLYISAVRQVLGIDAIDPDWSGYRHVSDQGILRELMEIHGIVPEAAVFDACRRAFVALLRQHIDAHGPFREIPGAVACISRLLASDRHYVAYATGAWRESAVLKLKSAGFPTEAVCLSTSSDFEDRVSIMRAAVANAPSSIERISYFGDGIWDRQAARQLGWDFVPVGRALGGIENFHCLAD